MKRMFSIITVLLVAPLALSACGGSEDTITIGYQNNGSIDPAQASMSLGMYEEYIEGDVELVFFDSGPASLTALGSGDVDIMTGIGNPPVASAIANNVPLSVVWAEELGLTDQALVVQPDSGISSVADLEGKQVATVVGSTSAYALNAVLAKEGLSEEDITVRNMDPQTLRSAWNKGEISAAYIWYPVLGELLNGGAVKLADNEDVSDVAPIYNFSVINTDWAADHPDAVQQFIKAQDLGVHAFRDEPESTLEAMIVDTGETMEEAKVASQSARPFDVTEQLDEDALGPNDDNSLVATSLLAASEYLHTLDPSHQVLQPDDIPIDRSFVKAYMNELKGDS